MILLRKRCSDEFYSTYAVKYQKSQPYIYRYLAQSLDIFAALLNGHTNSVVTRHLNGIIGDKTIEVERIIVMKKIDEIGFIGGGNMAEALIRGLVASGVSPDQITVAELMPQRRIFLEHTYGVATTEHSADVVAAHSSVILAVKPQVLEAALQPIATLFGNTTCLISILAGVSTTRIESILSPGARVIRVMPNTPALIGAGAAGLCAGVNATADDLAAACALFECVGVAQVVKESLLDAVTGLSGSGPAYVYLIIEALADGGVLEGLPRETALMLAAQTVAGAAQMVLDGEDHPAVLRDRVCSPAGTTIAAVRALEQGGVRAALIEAVHCAAQRSRELA